MGCDVHVCVEKFDGGKWVSVQPPSEWNSEKQDMSGGTDYSDGWFSDRHYQLFGRLADFPESWCQSTNAREYVEASWSIPAERAFSRWFKMLKMIEETHGRNTRIIMGFDS